MSRTPTRSGAQAYIYAFPWSYMAEARWTRSEPVGHQANRFDHVRKLEDASHVTGGAPNNDTLYSRAWVYLKDEPVILSVPAITDRYHSVEMADFMDDNFAYVGRRATGDEAGNFAIVGPGWKGTLPGGCDCAAAVLDALGLRPYTHLHQGRLRSRTPPTRSKTNTS